MVWATVAAKDSAKALDLPRATGLASVAASPQASEMATVLVMVSVTVAVLVME